MNKRGSHVKTINKAIENPFFHKNMSHIILLKVTKLQWPLLISLGVADEKPEGRGGGEGAFPR